MDELEKRLNAVLSDPEAMAQVSQMASQLMGQMAPAEAPAPTPGGGAAGDGGMMGMLRQLMRGMKTGKRPLVEAMAPYLAEDRRRRLERALGIASAVRLAGTAFREMGGNHGL